MKSLGIILLSLVCASGAFAQETDVNPRLWEAKVPGGEYVVALSRITSVSVHSYLLDGGLVVTEVTVDTEGASQARFYHLEPVSAESLNAVTTALERIQDIADTATGRVGLDEHTMVQKKYPLTTHSKTIEYRLHTRESLLKLYDSAKKSFSSGRGRRYVVK